MNSLRSKSNSRSSLQFVEDTRKNNGDNGEAGFEQLRKCVRQNSCYFADIIAVLDERADLEIIYAKSLQKLTAKLSKASKTSTGIIDSSWKIVADTLDGEGVIHRNLGLALKEEIVQPLKCVFESQQKTKKTVEHTVDKALKRLCDKRTEQLKLKKHSHSLSRDCEKVQRSSDEEKRRSVRLRTEKQLAKLESKRMKLEENVLKSEQVYRESVLKSEKERSELELVLTSAAARFENEENQRLANLQTALGRYQRHIIQFGPALTEMITRHIGQVDKALTADVETDLRTQVAHCQPQPIAYRALVLADFYAEDFSQLMNPERRKEALSRQLVQLQREMEKERKGKEGLEYLSNIYEATPGYSTADSRTSVKEKLNDSCTLLSFLDYHLFKLETALCSLEKKPPTVKPTHSLSKYEEKHKDKAGLRQTVLRVPLYAIDELQMAHGSSMFNIPESRREEGDGQSPSASEHGTMDPIYETLEQVEDESCAASSTKSIEPEINDEYVTKRTPKKAPAKRPSTDEGEGICTALFDFLPQRHDELRLESGDRIKIVRRVSDDWWEGSIIGKDALGLFPTNYVEMVPEAT